MDEKIESHILKEQKYKRNYINLTNKMKKGVKFQKGKKLVDVLSSLFLVSTSFSFSTFPPHAYQVFTWESDSIYPEIECINVIININRSST